MDTASTHLLVLCHFLMRMHSGTQTQDLILASLPIDPRFKEALIFKASYLVSV